MQWFSPFMLAAILSVINIQIPEWTPQIDFLKNMYFSGISISK